jgi:hypothetical protein
MARHTIGFRGDFKENDQTKLRNAGFDVYPESIRAGAAYWPGEGEPPEDWNARHVVVGDAADREDAARKVRDLLGRDLPDLIVAP